MENGKKQEDVNPAVAVLALGAVVCGAFYNKAAQIEFWFYEHLMGIVAVGMGLSAGVAMFALWRIKKKNAEYFERAKAVRTVKAKTSQVDYYKGGN